MKLRTSSLREFWPFVKARQYQKLKAYVERVERSETGFRNLCAERGQELLRLQDQLDWQQKAYNTLSRQSREAWAELREPFESKAAFTQELLRRCYHALRTLHPSHNDDKCLVCALSRDITAAVPSEKLMQSNSVERQQ